MFLHLRHLLTIDSLIFESCVKNHHFGIETHQKPSFKRIKLINLLMIVSFHTFYSIWEAFGQALGSFQDPRRRTFGFRGRISAVPGPPQSCIFLAWAAVLRCKSHDDTHYPLWSTLTAPSKPICIQKWPPNPSKINPKSIKHPSYMHVWL